MATLELTHSISGYDWEGKTRVSYKAVYDSTKNQTTVTFSESDFYYRGLNGYQTSALADITVTAVDNTSSSKTAEMSFSNKTTDGGYDRFPATPSPKSVTVQHSDKAGKKSVKIACTSTIKVYVGTSNQTSSKKSGSVTVKTGERKGYYGIDNGSKIVQVIPYIDDGSKWLECIPYVDNGSAWKVGN
jgi:hypothetical protein